MSSNEPVLVATKASDNTVVTGFKNHNALQRSDTKTTLWTLIRNEYPEYHVTETRGNSISLFDFAAAGKAKLVYDDESEGLHATRRWESVGEGVEMKMHPGKLSDEFQFVRFQYVWNDLEFVVYYAFWQDPLVSPERVSYILYPRAKSNIVDGHCPETDALLLAAGKWTSQLHEEIFIFDDGCWDKSKELWKSVQGTSWDDVILDPEMKKGLIEDVQGFFDNQALYKQVSVPWKRGIILHGVPGNGKTVSIKALIGSLYGRPDPIPSLYVKSFGTKRNTEQHSIRRIFRKARSMTPCLLIFEDLDSLVNDSVRSYFLNEVDGLESNDGILMIGSTNHLERLDPAISKRPSRFDRKYHYKIPGVAERKLYVKYWRTKLITNNNTMDFPEALTDIISNLTEGFSFAYLKEMFVMSLLCLVRGFKGEDFEDAASTDENTPSTSSTTTKTTPPTTEDKLDEVKTDAAEGKMAIPKVDIPEELNENLLLKVIKYQIRILQAEIDDTKKDSWSSGKKVVVSGTPATSV